MSRYFVAFALLMQSVSVMFAQDSGYPVRFQTGIQEWREGNVDTAIESLEKLYEDYPDSTLLLELLGQMEVERKNWDQARSWFQKAEQSGRKNLNIPYYLALCNRELGKHRAFLFRRDIWEEAEKRFKQVVNRTPWFQDVWYEYALLERYRGHYESAIEMTDRALEYNPHSRDVILGLYQLMDAFVHNQQARSWLQRRSDDLSAYFVGETYRRDGQLDEADSLWSGLLTSPDLDMSKIPVYLSYARLRMQQNRPAETEQFVFQAIDSIHSELDAELFFQDIKYILSNYEYSLFEKISRVSRKQQFFRAFWRHRNPIPASDFNHRLVEHYRRLLVAERDYRFDGFRIWFNNPDKMNYLKFPPAFRLNTKFNDKGLIFLRHGEPHDHAVTMGADVPYNESWIYYPVGKMPKMMFHFLLDENATGNNWRLTPVIPRALIESRIMWDPIFNRLSNAGDLEYISLQAEMADQSRDFVWSGLVSDRHRWQGDIEAVTFPFSFADFRADTQTNRYELYVGLPPEKVLRPVDADSSARSRNIKVRVLAQDSTLNTVFKSSRDIQSRQVRRMSDSLGMWIGQFSFDSSPDQHRISIYVEGEQDNQIGGYNLYYQPERFDSSTVQLSSIELSSRIYPDTARGPFNKHGLKVVPEPAKTFRREQPVFLYYEIYNLPVDRNAAIDYTIEYRLRLIEKKNASVFSKLFGWIGGDDEETFNRVERVARDSVVYDYIGLDLTEKDLGIFELNMVVTVPLTGESAESRTQFDLSDTRLSDRTGNTTVNFDRDN